MVKGFRDAADELDWESGIRTMGEENVNEFVDVNCDRSLHLFCDVSASLQEAHSD
jgi:hypothetical protein